jgi:ATP-dependent Clp protease protease subunit
MMLYPRTGKVNGKEVIVPNDCVVEAYEHLAKNYRFVNVYGLMGVDPASFSLLLALDSMNHEPIKLMINSPGGNVDALFILYDIFKLLKSPVYTIGSLCYSAAALLLSAGEKGHRYVMPHAKTMLHLISSEFSGDTREFDIFKQQTEKYEKQILEMLHEAGVDKTDKELLKDIDRDFWMDARETIEYGLADKILDKKTLLGWLGGSDEKNNYS